ncbi:APO protein 3, mitochondrial [Malania oleifera]|uniref:APO protein 3, mitochondrial n=1 Tax=Malania oleifera TaxID=397392 RepID=UPI0025AE4F83|nr:APO protein 3, mitochondrial [Malania oleifera]XP_057978096.1 APO protein 3, mitochondrial [Malania oleifera]
MQRRIVSHISLKGLQCQLSQKNFYISTRMLNLGAEGWVDDPLYADVPKPRRRKSERKPYPTPMKLLIRRAKAEREARKAQPCRMLEEPPDNGLLVPELVHVAHRVYQARESLLLGLSKLIEVIPVKRCRFCFEVHIGHVGHEIRTCTGPKSGFRSATHVWRSGGVHDMIYFPKCFHLYDRVGKPRVGHDERFSVQQVTAIVELCIQAGLELEKYPTRRRTKPVYCIEGRIVDFELATQKDDMNRNSYYEDLNLLAESGERAKVEENFDTSPDMEYLVNLVSQSNNEDINSLRELSILTLESWSEMISGTKKLMKKYIVNTCGYCPEVQVGPKGHKLRMCKASKHQSRNGLHAWQEATIDDLVGPNYVWHVRDPQGPVLANNLKRYYGKAPAAVEVCVQAGAPVPDQYKSMMRLEVVPPDRDEVDLVA